VQRSAANFVSRKSVEGEICLLSSQETGPDSIEGKLVCIEGADPGYDWIFSKRIGGLITKYGGANSHMTIRCAELGLPAAIGVGEQLFERLLQSTRVELRCAERVIRAIDD